MIWIWTVLTIVFVVICLTRISIRIGMQAGVFTLDVYIGRFWRIGIIPAPESPPRRKSRSEKNKTSKKKYTIIEDIPVAIEFLRQVKPLWPSVWRLVRRLGNGVLLHPFVISCVLGGLNHPDVTAQQYGYLHSLIWTLMPQAERFLHIPDPHIHLGTDFARTELFWECDIGIRFRIGTLLASGVALAISLIRVLWIARKEQQDAAPEYPDSPQTKNPQNNDGYLKAGNMRKYKTPGTNRENQKTTVQQDENIRNTKPGNAKPGNARRE